MAKIVCLADTHGMHKQVRVPKGDILIFAGDFSNRGTEEDLVKFMDWFGSLKHKYKIFIAGNHDLQMEDHDSTPNMVLKDESDEHVCVSIAQYCQDSLIEIPEFGLKIYGSPWQPRFCDWAFNLDRGPALAEKWAKIPEETNVLVTHGPPYGVRDVLEYELVGVGCEDLAERINILPNLKLHIFGHIHEGYGKQKSNGVTYVNASICTREYFPTNKPVVITI